MIVICVSPTPVENPPALPVPSPITSMVPSFITMVGTGTSLKRAFIPSKRFVRLMLEEITTTALSSASSTFDRASTRMSTTRPLASSRLFMVRSNAFGGSVAFGVGECSP